MRLHYSYFVALILLCGCTKPTLLMPEAKHIVIVHEKPKDCELIGEVDGYKKNATKHLNLKQVRDSARNDIKNNAYTMGADTIHLIGEDKLTSTGGVITGTSASFTGSNYFSSTEVAKEIHIHGFAYKCKK